MQAMNILAIDTSADETSAAVTSGRKVLSHIEYSQVIAHAKWGGIVPTIAKRAHEERIDSVIAEALRKAFPRDTNSPMHHIDAVAVTYGPGLAIALEVGIRTVKKLCREYRKKLIAVNHMEGHLYSSFAQNSRGNPKRNFDFPILAVLISGGHTEIIKWSDHLVYQVLGATEDDAAGEALDKCARMLGLGYPGGPIIERLSSEVNNEDRYHFPRPMTTQSKSLAFSFSGLKTSLFYFLKSTGDYDRIHNLRYIASSFQEAVFDTIVYKARKAVDMTSIRSLAVGGGVSANLHLRKKLRAVMEKMKGRVQFPFFPFLTGDNAAMIGIAAHYYAEENKFVTDIDTLEREPRLKL